MAGFIQNILWNSVEGFVEAGTRTAGEYAGNALIKAGDMIENGGRGVGNSIERKATTYASSISGQTYQPSPKALPSTARKPVVKRSNSMPANSKPATTPMRANKYPGKTAAGSAPAAAKKTLAGSTGGAKSSTVGATTPTRSIPPFKGPISASHPSSSNNLPKPYGGTSSPLSGRKTAVKPGQPKPFTPPAAKVEEKKTYPGTNTIPGQGSRTPVKQGKVKSLPRLGPQVGEGQKMRHIAV